MAMSQRDSVEETAILTVTWEAKLGNRRLLTPLFDFATEKKAHSYEIIYYEMIA